MTSQENKDDGHTCRLTDVDTYEKRLNNAVCYRSDRCLVTFMSMSTKKVP